MTDRSRNIRLIHYVSSLMILGSSNQTKVFHMNRDEPSH